MNAQATRPAVGTVCTGCGLTIGSVVNRGGVDDRTVRHDIVEKAVGRNVAFYYLREGFDCTDFRLSTRSGYAGMVEEVCVAD